MKFDVFTLFPEVFDPYLKASVLGKAQEEGLLEVDLHNIRDWAMDKHHVTDDTPYGGGGGMVMKPEPIFAAVEDVLGQPPSCPVLLMTPQGTPLNQEKARELSRHDHLAVLAGRYEGVDERVRAHLISEEISIGDYVLTGGELPALVLIDVLARLIPEVLGDPRAAEKDSHAQGLLEHPHYTRPASFRGWDVPEVLRSGHHARIRRWRREQALRRTRARRPDMLQHVTLSDEDRAYLDCLADEEQGKEDA